MAIRKNGRLNVVVNKLVELLASIPVVDESVIEYREHLNRDICFDVLRLLIGIYHKCRSEMPMSANAKIINNTL